MTTTFPALPWTKGDVFINETTGVSYTFNGSQWLASGGPDVEGEYLPLTGGDLSGLLNINVNSGVALSINSNKVKFWSSGAVELNGYTNFKDNELVTKKYVDDAVADADGGNSFNPGEQVAKTNGTNVEVGGFYVNMGNLYVRVS